MPNFIGRSRLLRYADPVTRQALPVPVEVHRGARAQDLAAFIARLNPPQRNALGDLGAYQLVHDLACYYEVNDYGEANGFRVLAYDVWESAASHAQGDPPAWRNTHLYQLPTKPDPNLEARIATAIEEEIVRADLRDAPAEDRDLRIRRGAVLAHRSVERI